MIDDSNRAYFRPRAKSILFTGRQVSAEESLGIGLVDIVVPDKELEHFSIDLAEQISENAPLSVLGAKKIVNALLQNPSEADVATLLDVSAKCYSSEDFREGVRAFLSKRKPNFVGR